MVGEEIDIGIFRNGTLVDFIGDEPSVLQDTVLTSCLFQSQTQLINSDVRWRMGLRNIVCQTARW